MVLFTLAFELSFGRLHANSSIMFSLIGKSTRSSAKSPKGPMTLSTNAPLQNERRTRCDPRTHPCPESNQFECPSHLWFSKSLRLLYHRLRVGNICLEKKNTALQRATRRGCTFCTMRSSGCSKTVHRYDTINVMVFARARTSRPGKKSETLASIASSVCKRAGAFNFVDPSLTKATARRRYKTQGSFPQQLMCSLCCQVFANRCRSLFQCHTVSTDDLENCVGSHSLDDADPWDATQRDPETTRRCNRPSKCSRALIQELRTTRGGSKHVG